MSTPWLSIGLPVYNGEPYLAESIEALLSQSYSDFELIISDNASTDGTADVCDRYRRQDSRIRYFRQPRNLGCAPNHNFTVAQARGELFKWASSDDLYHRDLLKLCVDALEARPDVVLAHSWTAIVNPASSVTQRIEYPLGTATLSPAQRFRSLLLVEGGDDDGGVIRMSVLRRVAPLGSYWHSDRTIVAELALYGPFYMVPDWLYFRREHPARALRAYPTVRGWCTNMDPRRAARLRHPLARLYGEYIWGYTSAIQRAPISWPEQRACYHALLQWAASRMFLMSAMPLAEQPASAESAEDASLRRPSRGGE
jgi:glycosyltransferase involved in cell wall biosynthesis